MLVLRMLVRIVEVELERETVVCVFSQIALCSSILAVQFTDLAFFPLSSMSPFDKVDDPVEVGDVLLPLVF